MHMIETTKLRLEPSGNWILEDPADRHLCSPELRGRIYWASQLFNTWVSSDCGKPEVELRVFEIFEAAGFQLEQRATGTMLDFSLAWTDIRIRSI